MRRRHPALFIGHGSPMQAIEPSRYTAAWEQLGRSLPRPRAIVVVSAHWVTNGTAVTTAMLPATIHDFYGFPAALYELQYPARGDAALAARVAPLAWGFHVGYFELYLVDCFPYFKVLDFHQYNTSRG